MEAYTLYRTIGNTRIRVVSAFAASAILNIFMWVFVASEFPVLRNAETQEPRELLTISSSHVRVQRAPPAALSQPGSILPPQPAALTLPAAWVRGDFGTAGAADVALWLNWKQQTSDFVSRVFLWYRKASGRNPSLHDAVQEVLASLQAEDVKLNASKPQRVCGGERTGWFFSYVKLWDDPPLHFDETVYLYHGRIYRAMYIRTLNQPEDSQTRDALNTLCL